MTCIELEFILRTEEKKTEKKTIVKKLYIKKTKPTYYFNRKTRKISSINYRYMCRFVKKT